MTLSKAEQERQAQNARNLEVFKGLYQEFDTLELPELKGSPRQIEVATIKRQKYVDMLKKGYQDTMKSAIKNGVGFQIESVQANIHLLKTRTTAGRW